MSENLQEPAIEVRGLVKVFRDFWRRPRVRAVDGLDLQIGRGEVFGLLGPNGSGKSTTIKILLGLLFPTKGIVRVLGQKPGDLQTRKKIGFLPEESPLYPYLNASETLNYYGRLFGYDRSSRRKRTELLLELVGLDAVKERAVGEFSKGMRRRLGLAQALINDPELLILDEPTSGLDPIGTRQVKDLIFELKQRGKTVLLSSHLLADVEDVCDRIAILYGGKKQIEGSCRELLTEGNSTQIELSTSDPATVDSLVTLLKEHGGDSTNISLKKPRRKLESLFIDIVRDARRHEQGDKNLETTSTSEAKTTIVSESTENQLEEIQSERVDTQSQKEESVELKPLNDLEPENQRKAKSEPPPSLKEKPEPKNLVKDEPDPQKSKLKEPKAKETLSKESDIDHALIDSLLSNDEKEGKN